jgi:signal transduction histidine kinase
MHSAPTRSITDEPDRVGERLLVPPAAAAHQVQFYEDDAFLAATVGDFIAAGLAAGEPVVVIATPAHRDAFARALIADGVDVEDAVSRERLAWLDARATLATFMDDVLPDAARFHAVMGDVLRARGAAAPRRTVRLFGEMVDVLWRDGTADGAIRLEALWNELAETHAFSLLCAYAIGHFGHAGDVPRFEQICRHHTRVIPTERYLDADDPGRLAEVALLQQRAIVLEAEVSAREALERRLLDRERELEALLDERERLLEAERASRHEAEEASRAKSDFLAMMSHELRTPLNAIGGHVQLVEMGIHGPVTDAQREALDRVQRGQRHLLAIINDVLNLSRIESGRVDYAFEPVCLAQLIAETVSMLEPLLTASALACDVPASSLDAPGVPAARADRERAHQILLNLLTNAIKFTPPGGRITVELGRGGERDAMVALRVHDTGIGIAPGQLERVFEPFVQIARQSRYQEGVGLGLAISRDLARGMGGDLIAESVAGEGTTFTLLLPAA